jgi:lipid A 3-O-deacylase
MNRDIVAKRFTIGQYIYTPIDISDRDLIVEDRPYAGLLYIDRSLYLRNTNDSRSVRSLSLLVGVVGDLSFAGYVQKEIHKIIDSREPMGWDHQLNNEFLLNFSLIERYVLYANDHVNLSIYGGGSLGNLNTQILFGSLIKFGIGDGVYGDYDFINFEPFPKNLKSKWYIVYVFAGVEQRVVAHNILLDGNTFSKSHSVDKNILVSEFMYGVSYRYKRFKAIYSMHFRSKEFDGQKDNFNFGTLSIIFSW